MSDEQKLRDKLSKIDTQGYGAYKEIKGSWNLPPFDLVVDYVQGDPYASPSTLILRADQSDAQIPGELFKNEHRRVALEDYLTRRFGELAEEIAEGHRGSGKSGLIGVVDLGQAVLQRSACSVDEDRVELVFSAGLPAKGRTVMGYQCTEMIFDEILPIARRSLLFENLPAGEVREHVETVEDARAIRAQLEERNLIGFVGDGAVLPRESGVGDRPMDHERAVPFNSPESLQVEMETPNRGQVSGMGVPEGVTLIVGGGYHGKSTLLNALAHGVYDHIPGDGREFVVAREDAVTVRAEDGRFVENTDISPFIDDVPGELDTSNFSSEDASGSTSQAANILEMLEAGAGVLLIDEDTSATNFMIRDERMQELVAPDKEPITPLIDRIRLLYEQRGVSSVLVMGGSGDYFDVADTVIMMDEYEPRDVTGEAERIAESFAMRRQVEGGSEFGAVVDRCPDPASISPRKNGGKVKIKSHGDEIQFGYDNIDISRLHQISEEPQVRAIGDVVFYLAKHFFDGETTVAEALDEYERVLKEKGLSEFYPYVNGDYAVPRRYEIAAALNRLRTLECEQRSPETSRIQHG